MINEIYLEFYLMPSLHMGCQDGCFLWHVCTKLKNLYQSKIKVLLDAQSKSLNCTVQFI